MILHCASGASTDQRSLNFSLLNCLVSSSVGRKLDLSNLRNFSRCSNLLCSFVTWSDESDMLHLQTLDVLIYLTSAHFQPVGQCPGLPRTKYFAGAAPTDMNEHELGLQ